MSQTRGHTMITNIEELKTHIVILDIVGHYIPLQKNGGNYVACCPFHDEKTPSFMVNPSKNIFYCFGCNKGGDAITFVKEYNKVEFSEAIQEIARIIGFKLEYSKGRIDNSLEINQEFLEYCTKRSQQIQDFCLKRGITEDIIQDFGLGYSGEHFEIRNALSDSKKAIQLGLLYDTPNGLKSPFAKRLIIPIFNHNGKCVGFSGRELTKTHAKYINSKESPFYKKKTILYGFHIAKKYIPRAKEVFIVEGYFDVMALHVLGYKNSVAICGTALSKEHIALLTKYEDITINLALDNDNAGLQATKKAIMLLLGYEIYDAFVVHIDTKCKDFNDILLHDRKALESMQKIPIIAFMLQEIRTRLHDGSLSIESRAKIIKECKAFLDTIKNQYIKKQYIEYANSLFGFEIDRINIQPQRQNLQNNIMSYDIVLARVLKAAYKNQQYIDILKQYTKQEYFTNLQDVYNEIMDSREDISPLLAHILCNDECVFDYQNMQDFLHDIQDIALIGREHYMRNMLITSNLSLQDKIGMFLSKEAF